MKTIKIEIDDRYADVISITAIGVKNGMLLNVSTKNKEIDDGMTIKIGQEKTREEKA